MQSSNAWKGLLPTLSRHLKKRRVILLVLFILIAYTRFINLDWGLPYPMHPDERNMATAIQSLNCEIQNSKFKVQSCMNPNFFAYGQFPLYLGYLIVQFGHFLSGRLSDAITYSEAAMALRIISTISSILNVFVLMRIIQLLLPNSQFRIQNYDLKSRIKNQLHSIQNTLQPRSGLAQYWILAILIFLPYSIQFAHFGTTESLLMLIYSSILYLCLKIIVNYLTIIDLALVSLLLGIAVATKVSSVIFIALPVLTLFYVTITSKKINFSHRIINFTISVTSCLIFTALFALVLSPHNIINFKLFINSFSYESSVATGAIKVFYTRQFENTIPMLFQLMKVFPYVLGGPAFILSLVGFFGLSWKDKKINLLRFAILIYFIPTAFLYAKWTRFMAPILPLMTVFAVLGFTSMIQFIEVKRQQLRSESLRFITAIIAGLIGLTLIIPGISYLSVYQNPDVRFTASEWIEKNIPENSYILSETANVVDIPMATPVKLQDTPVPFGTGQASYKIQEKNYTVISFDFYNLETDPLLVNQLDEHLSKADYILVPSRRLFANHTCTKVSSIEYLVSSMKKQRCKNLKTIYPLLSQYYGDLFSGKSGFVQVAEISSYPKLKLFGKTLFEFPDEDAEETWTVFDHPVVRIYKRV